MKPEGVHSTATGKEEKRWFMNTRKLSQRSGFVSGWKTVSIPIKNPPKHENTLAFRGMIPAKNYFSKVLTIIIVEAIANPTMRTKITKRVVPLLKSGFGTYVPNL